MVSSNKKSCLIVIIFKTGQVGPRGRPIVYLVDQNKNIVVGHYVKASVGLFGCVVKLQMTPRMNFLK